MIEETTTTERPAGAVCVEIPAEPRFVALIRVAAASMAADLDPVIDDVDDLRVAVNELVGLMVEAAEGGSVVVHLWSDERTIHVTGRCNGPSSRVSPDQLTLRILDATVDSYDVGDGSFRVRKRLGAV
ncbi:ATP-binding protein [Dermatobacter hominis]|uniref:ATP-binding protein n=1 Tax=Dermatobacter hominis TaxID=2884263 RepID=UPI001D110D96|nr:hypothetical protein [Dermatobacter hominis]UDY35295.1 hypothetical protein LH044_18410 [Dermatobacter hominis]